MAHMPDSSIANGTPDPEVTAKAQRRRFTAKYKLRILREAEVLAETSGIGEMLRREGLYSSHLTSWRAARERGELDALAPKKRGRRPTPGREIIEENRRLARENERLEKQLVNAVLEHHGVVPLEPLCAALGGDERPA